MIIRRNLQGVVKYLLDIQVDQSPADRKDQEEVRNLRLSNPFLVWEITRTTQRPPEPGKNQETGKI